MSIDRDDLAQLVAALPQNSRVEPNAVGNLLITDKDGIYLGYIDLKTCTVELEGDPV